jgi:hypothetical protein
VRIQGDTSDDDESQDRAVGASAGASTGEAQDETQLNELDEGGAQSRVAGGAESNDDIIVQSQPGGLCMLEDDEDDCACEECPRCGEAGRALVEPKSHWWKHFPNFPEENMDKSVCEVCVDDIELLLRLYQSHQQHQKRRHGIRNEQAREAKRAEREDEIAKIEAQAAAAGSKSRAKEKPTPRRNETSTTADPNGPRRGIEDAGGPAKKNAKVDEATDPKLNCFGHWHADIAARNEPSKAARYVDEKLLAKVKAIDDKWLPALQSWFKLVNQKFGGLSGIKPIGHDKYVFTTADRRLGQTNASKEPPSTEAVLQRLTTLWKEHQKKTTSTQQINMRIRIFEAFCCLSFEQQKTLYQFIDSIFVEVCGLDGSTDREACKAKGIAIKLLTDWVFQSLEAVGQTFGSVAAQGALVRLSAEGQLHNSLQVMRSHIDSMLKKLNSPQRQEVEKWCSESAQAVEPVSGALQHILKCLKKMKAEDPPVQGVLVPKREITILSENLQEDIEPDPHASNDGTVQTQVTEPEPSKWKCQGGCKRILDSRMACENRVKDKHGNDLRDAEGNFVVCGKNVCALCVHSGGQCNGLNGKYIDPGTVVKCFSCLREANPGDHRIRCCRLAFMGKYGQLNEKHEGKVTTVAAELKDKQANDAVIKTAVDEALAQQQEKHAAEMKAAVEQASAEQQAEMETMRRTVQTQARDLKAAREALESQKSVGDQDVGLDHIIQPDDDEDMQTFRKLKEDLRRKNAISRAVYEEDDLKIRNLMTACDRLLDTNNMLRAQLERGPPAAESSVAPVQPAMAIEVPMSVSARAGARGAQNPPRPKRPKSSCVSYVTGGNGGESGSSSESEHDKASDRG